jgi:Family of unknown function (DUF6491)
MKNALRFAAALAVASISLGAGAHATSSSAPSRAGKNECVFTRSIYDFKALDRHKLVIWAPSRSKAYLVELSMPLPELKFASRLALVDRNHDGRLCGYGMDRVAVADSSFALPSTILGMTRLDEAGLAQLEQQYDVRLTRKKAGKTAAVEHTAPAQAQDPLQKDNPEND